MNDRRPPIIECDSCGFRFDFYRSLVKEVDVKIKNKNFKLNYLFCPKCDAIYKIALKDKEYLDLEEDLEFAQQNLKKALNNKYSSYKIEILKEVVNTRKLKLKNKHIALERAYKGKFEIKRTNDSDGLKETVIYRDK